MPCVENELKAQSMKNVDVPPGSFSIIICLTSYGLLLHVRVHAVFFFKQENLDPQLRGQVRLAELKCGMGTSGG